MLRKWILENRSQQYREIAKAYKDEGTNDILTGGLHIASGILSGEQITGAIKGWQGGNQIGYGLQKKSIGSDYEEMANRLQEKANQSQWWHLW